MQTLDKATEGSTYIIQMDFYDQDGNLVSPATMFWTLRDENESIVNEREEIEISSPSSTEYVVLGREDTLLSGKSDGKRYIICEGTYDSPTYGSGIPLTKSATFDVEHIWGYNPNV